MKQVGLVVAMLLLGFASLLGFAFVVEIRQGTSIPASAAPDGGTAVGRARGGLEATLAHALGALERDQQTPAAHALDAAMRAARVVEHAAPKTRDAPFAEARARIEDARRAMQNGDRDRSLAALRQALVTVRNEVDPQAASPPPTAIADYVGATVLDPHGVRAGEVVDATAAGTPSAHLTLVVHGWRDVLGFWDMGGDRVDVPMADLLFGEQRVLGNTDVMWLGAGSQPAASGR